MPRKGYRRTCTACIVLVLVPVPVPVPVPVLVLVLNCSCIQFGSAHDVYKTFVTNVCETCYKELCKLQR